MENQDKLFDKFKETFNAGDGKSFSSMENIWDRVEEKLDEKEDRKIIPFWKKLALAASLLLLLSIGYQYLKSEKGQALPRNFEQNIVVINDDDSVDVKSAEKELIVPQAEKILQRQLNPARQVAINDTIISNTEYIESDAAVVKENIPASEIAATESLDVQKTAASSLIEERWTITGVVSDETGSLPGANVFVRGTGRVTQTDFDGRYAIRASAGDILDFSYVGYNQKSVTVNNKKPINVKLEAGAALAEVVVEGYRSRRTVKALAYSTTTVTSSSVSKPSKKRPNADTTQDLQGKVSGLNIQNGNTSSVVIRGVNAISAPTDKLYIVNGVPATESDITKIAKEKIQSVDVLRGNAATSLYGSRAQNGVIIINTGDDVPKKEARKNAKKIRQFAKKDSIRPTTYNTEDYDPFIENAFESPKNSPLSTFSIDVDNASYTNVRRFINYGQKVPKDAVRVEEMINFFKYEYPQPKDNHPFSINTEYSDCPWNPQHRLLRIGLQGKIIATDKLPASNFVFLIDVSGSMAEENKLPLLKESMRVLVNELRETDKVSIVVYAGAAGLVLPPTPGNKKDVIISALDNLSAGGSTAGGQGIELAYKIAQENFIKDGNNRVVLATDGDFNVGASSNSDMEQMIEQKRKSGVFLTCLGYGMGNYKDSKMEILANKGNGNYAYIDNLQEANRFLGREFKGSMFAIAKDVKIQIEFNPIHVQSYRLIGYENRKLRPEDFVNDEIDAGELGSGHTVTALYEIIPIGVKSELFTEMTNLKYTKSNPTGNASDLATVKFRYKKPDGDKSIEMIEIISNQKTPIGQSTKDFKFSAAVAWFGLKLRESKLISNKSSDQIIKLGKEGLANDIDGYKAEFIRLVETHR